jgi:3-oxoacyl-[acyl-carrier-protein] synthase-3
VAFLRAFGRYLPERIVDNNEIGPLIGADASWIEQVSGISQRRFAAAGETVIDLAEKAARHCLANSAAAGPLGMVIVASGTAPRRFPGPAAVVAQRLGLADIPALDLPMPSAGSLFAITLAAQVASSSSDVLVVAAEKASDIILQRPIDPGTASLFGDGAGACMVSSTGGTAEIMDFAIHSDGSFAEDLHLEFAGPLTMNGRSVILQASRKIPRVIREVLDRVGIPAEEVATFILHQANRNLLEVVARTLDVPAERFYSNIKLYGNTSSASMLIAASEWSETERRRTGEPLVFAAFGAGFHWGALVARRTDAG